MASLDFLAAGVQDDQPWIRTSSRKAEPNPFDAKLEESWNARQTYGTGASAKVRGATKSITVQTYDQLKQVKNALNRAVKDRDDYGVGIAYFGPAFYRTVDGEDVNPEDAGSYDADDFQRTEDGNPIEFRNMLDPIKNEEDWTKAGTDVTMKFRAQPKRRMVESAS